MQKLHDTNLSRRNGSTRSSASLPKTFSTAVVHDWLPVYAGAERVLEQILLEFPASDVFSLIEFLNEQDRTFLNGKSVTTSFIQNLPFARSRYRYYLPLAPLAIEQFDLNDYDVVLSSSYVVAKGVLTTSNQLHVCYVHSPVRYAWDLYFPYLHHESLTRGMKGLLARLVLHYIRLFDSTSANRVDVFVANSKNVARRIWKTYRRHARVIYPPIDTDHYTVSDDRDEYFVTLSRLVPYKRIDLIVEAFSEMPEKELIVIGDGPDYRRLASKAPPNVTMLGYQPAEAVKFYLQRARAFVFAAEEDFGIVPLEAQACGTPVIAFGKGGALETVRPGETGVFFEEQTTESLKQALRYFEFARHDMNPWVIRQHAEKFASDRFRREINELITQEYTAFLNGEHSN